MRKRLASFYAEEMYAEDRPSPSARVVVPMVIELTHPSSVLDVGCGRGAWLSAFIANGIEQVVGLDGDYIKPSTLLFPADRFRPTNLSIKFEIPPDRFDLAICLEVAEHLPAPNSRHLVRQLTSAASQVLFSAAPPGQGGGGHINCKPLSYWRKIFEEFRIQDARSIPAETSRRPARGVVVSSEYGHVRIARCDYRESGARRTGRCRRDSSPNGSTGGWPMPYPPDLLRGCGG